MLSQHLYADLISLVPVICFSKMLHVDYSTRGAS
nr:MAG TPA: hypothetical protein [Siphoviridae sp. ctBfm1]